MKLQLTGASAPPITLTFAACPGTPGQSLVLREQPGRAARAGASPMK
jgi:hypothetical protein